jgi:hypothetical protein
MTGAVNLDVPGCHGSSSSVALAADDEGIVAAAACADPSLAFPPPFRMLAVTEGTGPLTKVA